MFNSEQCLQSSVASWLCLKAQIHFFPSSHLYVTYMRSTKCCECQRPISIKLQHKSQFWTSQRQSYVLIIDLVYPGPDMLCIFLCPFSLTVFFIYCNNSSNHSINKTLMSIPPHLDIDICLQNFITFFFFFHSLSNIHPACVGSV